ncbi:MAG: hypothetical protein ABI384_02285 [Allobranchiibius sp.]
MISWPARWAGVIAATAVSTQLGEAFDDGGTGREDVEVEGVDVGGADVEDADAAAPREGEVEEAAELADPAEQALSASASGNPSAVG